jgi:CDP-diacylglycerol---serine O-phosphatidyltransferase
MKNIPNLFTLLNLVLGCVAIIFILQTGQAIVYIEPDGYTSWDLPEKITWGAICIFAAAVVDFLDGFIARLFKASSEMGKQLDSFADVVSFGVAPGLILYQLLRISYGKEVGGLDVSISALLPALIIPCAAAWRLAKFNLDAGQAKSFKGVPTPAAGLLIASIPMIIFYQQYGLQELLVNKWLIYTLILILAYLMVSNISMMSLKYQNFRWKENLLKLVLLAIAIISIPLLKWVSVPVIFLVYVLLSLLPKNRTHDI